MAEIINPEPYTTGGDLGNYLMASLPNATYKGLA